MELQLQVAGEVQDGAMEDAPMDKEERERLKKEEAEEKKKKEEEAAERAKEAAQAMTEEERQAACRAQQEDAGKKEDAAEEKLFRYATASEAQLYALPPDTWVAAVDGGHTAAQEPAGADAGAPEKSGFGFSVHEVWQKGLTPKRPRNKWRRRPTIPKDKPQEERQIESDAWEMATEAERHAWQEGAKERVVKRRRTHARARRLVGLHHLAERVVGLRPPRSSRLVAHRQEHMFQPAL
jgi:hypothetical protein